MSLFDDEHVISLTVPDPLPEDSPVEVESGVVRHAFLQWSWWARFRSTGSMASGMFLTKRGARRDMDKTLRRRLDA